MRDLYDLEAAAACAELCFNITIEYLIERLVSVFLPIALDSVPEGDVRNNTPNGSENSKNALVAHSSPASNPAQRHN
jgi:hypothetical protein